MVIGSILLVSGLATGCTNTSAGQPLPTATGRTTDGTDASPSSNSSTSGSAPARPQELRLDGKDPCALVPQSDWPKFYIDKPGKPGQDETFKSPDCFYSNNVLGLGIALVVTEGINKWTDGSRTATAQQVAPIEGFPAISVTRNNDKYTCAIAVDVANGQYLWADVNLTPSKASQVPERCEYAHQWAESAMRTLVRGG
ncbi:MAG: DUF3558 domain-containing protein [Labedaea sp.]